MRYLSLAFALVFTAVSTTGFAADLDSVIVMSTDNNLITHTLSEGVELSYVLRVQSSEIKSGTEDRTLAWGGLVLSKRLSGR